MILDQIRTWLISHGVNFREAHHEPTRTSEESARARGEEMRVGGKALLIKVDDVFRLFILSADRKLDSGAIKRHFSAKKTRFATPEELMELTGLVPGSVPPFGAPILPFPLYVDPSVFENDRIAFNAGSLTDSIVMPIADYRRLTTPEVFSFAASSEA
ncbi:MAG TPA: YbaK/EbsC family protein [Bryobacteraceae bacterium]|nr:YbaK/EbsC family protein [Bryobacteraceae bacterium]